MNCHGSVINFDVPMPGAKCQDQIPMCQCQVPRAQGQEDFPPKPKRCTKHDEIPQKPSLLMTRASFYQCFQDPIDNSISRKMLGECSVPPYKASKKKISKKILKVRNRKGIGIGIQKQGRASRQNPQNHRKAEFLHEFKWA